MSLSYSKQFRTVLVIELSIVVGFALISLLLWNGMCRATWQSCLSTDGMVPPSTFLLVSALRPFLFAPFPLLALIGGDTYGTFFGTIMTSVGGVLSSLIIFVPAAYLGRRLVRPWLRSNLPATYELIRTQDYKVIFLARLIPFLPFDLLSLLFAAVGFRWRAVVGATFFGTLPEAFMFARAAKGPDLGFITSTLESLTLFALGTAATLITFEFFERKRGTSLWSRMRRMYDEIVYEVKLNNDITRRFQVERDQVPVLLLYGFFSSRRSLTIMERLLVQRGFQVLSFNLGGLLGVFFTRGIPETAAFVDHKLHRQMDRHQVRHFHIVGHSKGGLVALWWFLKLGGHKYCDRVVTMGTPFRGSWLTYLALVTPLGFLWRDVWQMRPGSEVLAELNNSEIPEGRRVYCFYSAHDRVAVGERGIFQPLRGRDRVIPVPRPGVAHFDFLSKREVADVLAQVLREDITVPAVDRSVAPS